MNLAKNSFSDIMEGHNGNCSANSTFQLSIGLNTNLALFLSRGGSAHPHGAQCIYISLLCWEWRRLPIEKAQKRGEEKS